MGIKGLHKGLSFCTKKTSILEFSGQSVAVDSSSWLHRSVYSISEKYVESTERKVVDANCVRVSARYISGRCRELLDNVRIRSVLLVMDGKRCPMKANENEDREQRRQQNLKEARDYKRNGRGDKAEEKYKTCIKIREDFTIAVMKEVARAFSNDHRVQFVWSPYEADAQLAQLCIDRRADAVVTEDSDVLVYSAAAHTPFPVIFKLDRSSGSCDVIRLDWLLTSQTTPSKKSAGNALETVLMSLASRQAKRPGFGVRLFVQSCVLAGCDYAPNKLAGIGLVNAFKHVRDNAYRNDEVRLSKVLDALPRRSKAGLDIKEYEEILAKSEAVFYYHIVQHFDGSVKPMLEPRRSHSTGDEHKHSDHFPCLLRFDDEAFLGVSDSIRATPSNLSQAPVPVARAMQKRKCMESVKPLQNPYIYDNNKRLRTTPRQPLHDVGSDKNRFSNPTTNRFAQFARKCSEFESISKPSTPTAHRQNQHQRRFGNPWLPFGSHSDSQERVNKIDQFKPFSAALHEEIGSTGSSQNDNGRAATEPCHSQECLDQPATLLEKENSNLSGDFDYETAEDCVAESSDTRFSLDESDHGVSLHDEQPDLASDDSCTAHEAKNRRTSKGIKSHSEDGLNTYRHLTIALSSDEDSDDEEEAGVVSKYFAKGGSRRVTLDPSDQPVALKASDEVIDLAGPDRGISDSETNASAGVAARTSVIDRRLGDDEVIESPESAVAHCTPRIPHRKKLHFGGGNESTRSRSHAPTKAKRKPQSGPLENAFRRQIQFSSQDYVRQSRPRPNVTSSSSSSRTKHGTKSLKAFFNPVKTHTDQTDEDFLWL